MKRITKLLIVLSLLQVSLLALSTSTNAYGSQNGRIIYIGVGSGDTIQTDIFLMNPDGSDQVNLTNSAGADENPSWSPDGRKILFAKKEVTQENADLFLMNPDGSDQVNLTNTPDFDENAATWSPDGNYIRFTSQSRLTPSSGKLAYFTIRPDGSELTEMPILINPNDTNVAGWAYAFQPWSPDSSRMIIAQEFESGERLYTIEPDGSNPVQISGFMDGYNWAGGMSWSPDSSKIFFEEFGEAHTGYLKVVDSADGSILSQEAVSDDRVVTNSQWLNDGTTILYAGKEQNIDRYAINLYKMEYNGSSFGSPTKLTDYGCNQDAVAECGVYPIFQIEEGKLLYAEMYPQVFEGAATNIYAGFGDLSSFSSLTGFVATPNMSKLSLLWYSPMEPLNPTEPPAPTPEPPKTGKLIGATIATVSLISIILLMAKEIKDKHHEWGGEK